MTALTTTLLFWAGAASGFTGHARPAPRVACCDVCGIESARVAELIRRVQCCPRWRDRDNAAHALRKYDWRCHPEIALVLATAMMTDCEEEVREEAAESLAKMKPCLPEVHAALARTAKCDPDHATRKWARRGLGAIGERCVAQCRVCGVDEALPATYVVPIRARRSPAIVVPAPRSYELPIAPPAEELMPPSELPAIPGGGSPFVSPLSDAGKPEAPKLANQPEEKPRPRLALGRLLRGGR